MHFTNLGSFLIPYTAVTRLPLLKKSVDLEKLAAEEPIDQDLRWLLFSQ